MMKAKDRGSHGRALFLAAVASLLLAGFSRAQSAAPDVGLVTKLSGEATYQTKDTPKAVAVQAFMKVRQGDRLKLAPASSLQLLYFASGRQETWKGPATLVAGAGETTALGGKEPPPQPQVKTLPTKATRQMGEVPQLLHPPSTARSGVIVTMAPRSAPAKGGASAMKGAGSPTMVEVDSRPGAKPLTASDQKRLKEAEALYQGMRQQAAPDDLTPELYLLGILDKYRQYPQMLQLVDLMLRQRPGDAALEEMKNRLRARTGAQD